MVRTVTVQNTLPKFLIERTKKAVFYDGDASKKVEKRINQYCLDSEAVLLPGGDRGEGASGAAAAKSP